MESPSSTSGPIAPAKETNQTNRKPKPPSKRSTSNYSKETKHSNGKRDHNNNNKNNNNKKKTKDVKTLKRGVASIEFDATARYQHLTGFSERKRARRTYGLAQQKLKDRRAKLEQRAARRTAEREFIAEAEQLKQQHYEDQVQQQQQQPSHGALLVVNVDNNDDNVQATTSTDQETVQILVFDGTATEQQWGGHVVVTTSTHIPGDSDNDDDNHNNNNNNNNHRNDTTTNHDTEQVKAGKIETYIQTLQGHLPKSKKRTTSSSSLGACHNQRTKGQHGAVHMKGVGNAAEFKVAQQMLSRSKSRFTKIKGGPGGRSGHSRK